MRSQPSLTFWSRVHPQLADRSGLDIDPGVRVDDSDLDTRQRSAHGPDTVGVAMIVWQQSRVGAQGLGLTKHVGERHMRQRGHRPLHQRDGRGRRPVGDGGQRRQVGAGEVGMVEDPLQHRRHHEAWTSLGAPAPGAATLRRRTAPAPRRCCPRTGCRARRWRRRRGRTGRSSCSRWAARPTLKGVATPVIRALSCPWVMPIAFGSPVVPLVNRTSASRSSTSSAGGGACVSPSVKRSGGRERLDKPASSEPANVRLARDTHRGAPGVRRRAPATPAASGRGSSVPPQRRSARRRASSRSTAGFRHRRRRRALPASPLSARRAAHCSTAAASSP